ncbi:MAG: hypothetical protein CMH35_00335 [Microbacterium sp.]|nr:hypothetical protein [Microbacterium sp.]|tara:strand:+ start:1576 stop:2901 length:1326 start_codon:yes stop_codon:yes gene_type:complete
MIAGVFVALVGMLIVAAPASAHVVPSTVIALDAHDDGVTASLTLPAADLELASGIDVPDDAGAVIDAGTADALEAYLEDHMAVSSDSGSWDVAVADIALSDVEQWGTGAFLAVTATAELTAPTAADARSFVLAYDAIIHQVVTADIFVTLQNDWVTGEFESTRDLGTIHVDTVTGTVSPLPIDLDDGSLWQGFTGMVGLGLSHIAEGTDHQLFLLTLLLPAPLLTAAGRWRGVAPVRTTVRRILGITIAFTVGHSVTLAMGTLGLPVPVQLVEALIAASIVVAAVHAIRPIFPGREALVAGLFGLIHGMAFSLTLTALDLTGWQLVLSLLGFNLGIELMQLAVVALVLPPLVVLARTRVYSPLRIVAAGLIALAAIGWVLDRLGVANAIATIADGIGALSPWIAGALWVAAALAMVLARVRHLVDRRCADPVDTGSVLRVG